MRNRFIYDSKRKDDLDMEVEIYITNLLTILYVERKLRFL